jgi:hypothetical protein
MTVFQCCSRDLYQGSKFTTATTAIAVVAPQTGRGAPRKNTQSKAILAAPFLSLAAVPPEDAKKSPSRTGGRVKNELFFRLIVRSTIAVLAVNRAMPRWSWKTSQQSLIFNTVLHAHTCTRTCARAGTVEVSMAGCVAHGIAVRTTPL